MRVKTLISCWLNNFYLSILSVKNLVIPFYYNERAQTKSILLEKDINLYDQS